MSDDLRQFKWNFQVFIFPRTLIDGTKSRSCDLLAWKRIGGIKYYRHVTDEEVYEYYSEESW